MTDLRNTIAHILEHKQHLAEANEATMQQYVVLPILRALGWDDANLASMEVLPEYAAGGQVDYALKVEGKLLLFLECKRWSEPLKGHHASQVTNYAFNAGGTYCDTYQWQNLVFLFFMGRRETCGRKNFLRD